MSDWYKRQFGDVEQFAVTFSLGRDPHPLGIPQVDASWGGLSVWVQGRCLTRSVAPESGVADEVRWSLLGLVRWLRETAIRLVNEEPFPLVSGRDTRDACAWVDATEGPPWTLSGDEDSQWFLTRSDWRRHHALRASCQDVALPNIIIRRLGDFLEVSWDNEGWGSVRKGVSFVERRGTELVPAARASEVLLSALRDVTSVLADKTPDAEFSTLNDEAQRLNADDEDWKWLVPQATAALLAGDPELSSRLRAHVRKDRRDIYVPHSPLTLLLRSAVVTSRADLDKLLRLHDQTPAKPVSEKLRALIEPTPASVVEPWNEGYDRAIEVRDELGWGIDPLPDLEDWLERNNVLVRRAPLPSAVDSLTKRTEDARALAGLNSTSGAFTRETGLAEALGHLLMDVEPVAVHGTREHWPTAARARAFGVMLLLPEEGVGKLLKGVRSIGADEIRRVMNHFRTGPYATTFHLMNHGLIGDEERQALLRALVA